MLNMELFSKKRLINDTLGEMLNYHHTWVCDAWCDSVINDLEAAISRGTWKLGSKYHHKFHYSFRRNNLFGDHVTDGVDD